jgi:hypothetical protein
MAKKPTTPTSGGGDTLSPLLSKLSNDVKGIRGQFKQAANDNNKSVSSISKDIGRHFSRQQSQIKSLSSNVDEVEATTQKLNSKIESAVAIINNDLSADTEMLSIVKTILRHVERISDKLENGNDGEKKPKPGDASGVLGDLGKKIVAGVGVGTAMAAGTRSGTGSSGESTGSSGSSGSEQAKPYNGPNKPILDTIKQKESGGDYTAQNKSSSASGAYQFIDKTWKTRAEAAGVDTKLYPRAKDAPPEIQDKVADAYITEILKQVNGDVSKVPVVWYTGNPQGKSNAASPQQVAAYKSDWMAKFEKNGGKIEDKSNTTAQAGGAATPGSSTGESATPQGGAPVTPSPSTGSDATPKQQSEQPGGKEESGSEKPSGGKSSEGGMASIQSKSGPATKVAAEYAKNFQGFIDALEGSGYKIKSLGGFANRNIAGSDKASWHSKGMAIDINPGENPVTYGESGRKPKTDMPQNVQEMAAKFGLGWGGAWDGDKQDAMHFSLGEGPGAALRGQREAVGLGKGGGGGSGAGGSTQTASTGGGVGTGGSGGSSAGIPTRGYGSGGMGSGGAKQDNPMAAIGSMIGGPAGGMLGALAGGLISKASASSEDKGASVEKAQSAENKPASETKPQIVKASLKPEEQKTIKDAVVKKQDTKNDAVKVDEPKISQRVIVNGKVVSATGDYAEEEKQKAAEAAKVKPEMTNEDKKALAGEDISKPAERVTPAPANAKLQPAAATPIPLEPSTAPQADTISQAAVVKDTSEQQPVREAPTEKSEGGSTTNINNNIQQTAANDSNPSLSWAEKVMGYYDLKDQVKMGSAHYSMA